MFEVRARRKAITPQLTSLADIVFLLIVFFMVSAEFGLLTVTPVASSGDAKAEKEDGGGELEHLAEGIQVALLGGGMANFNGMVTSLNEGDHMIKTLLAHMPRGVPPRAHIYCRKAATVQELATLSELMKRAGLTEINISAFPGE